MNKPDDLIELGRIGEPYGLKGLVNVLPSSEQPEVLLKARQWWVSRLKPTADGAVRKVNKPTEDDLLYEPFKILSAKVHADRLVAHLEGVEDRDLAARFKGCRVYVSRSRFPALPEGEFYWVDLVGCAVTNVQGVELGVVTQVADHGAHAILQVTKGDLEHLIPFVEAYVPTVDLAARRIVADWQEDY
ncbi:MAG TPA: ribosome maturation factor RimM [Limnobacter sp.]|uniref:ribosome maturation factor RimM n=1 Tax=Limnobacter sp. TaxID=2003368 RepID=UPI002EDB67A2